MEIPQTMRLLEAIQAAQSKFILESSTRTAYKLLLDELLCLTQSEYGFIGEVETDRQGKPVLRVWAYTDISWNEETRQLLRDNAANGLLFEEMQSLFGYAILNEETVIANDASNDPRGCGVPDGHPPLNAFLGMPFKYGNRMIGLIGLANRKDGYDQEIVDFLSPMVTTCGVLAHARRMTEEQERNRRLVEEADHTQRLVEFSRKLAHDLNNLLTVTMTTVDSHRLSPQATMPSEDVDVIHVATTRAAELTQKILSCAGSTAINRRAISLCDAIKEARVVCESVLPPSIELTVQDTDSSLFVDVDPNSLQQVLMNIIFNSIEAIGENDGTISVRTHVSDGKVAIEIADDGPGMDDATRSRAFDPYFSTKPGIRGFGLASVMGFVNSHSAHLELETSHRKGTQLTMRLPLVQQPESASEKTAGFQFEGKQILVVDDDQSVSHAICRLLNQCGATVQCAESGMQALELLANGSVPDVVFLDICMPGMDGVETCYRIRSDIDESLPVVFLSGQSNRIVPKELSGDSRVKFVRKPFSLDDLRTACAAVV